MGGRRRRPGALVAVPVLSFSLVLTACSGSGEDTGQAPSTTVLADRGALSPPPRVPVPADPAPSAWSQASADAAHTSTTSATGPRSATVRWRRDFPAAVTQGPAIGIDGSVLVAANDGKLRALDPATGATRWTFDGEGYLGGDLSATPAVLRDGTILWPGPNSSLYALDRAGTLLWSEKFNGQVLSPAVVGGGRVYLTTTRGGVAALDISAGRRAVVWKLSLGGTSYTSPTVAPDGTLYAASDRTLHAIVDQGSEATTIWTFTSRDILETGTAVAPDGTVVLGTNADDQYAFNPDGTTRWRFPKPLYSYSPPVIRDGLAYFGDHSGAVNVVDADTGEPRQRLAGLPTSVGYGVGPWTSPLVDAAGSVYFGTEAGHIYGFTADGARLWDLDTGDIVASYPALTADGTLVIGDQGGTVYALRD